MKRLIIILTLSLLTSSNLFAAEFNNQNQFNKWLLENGHSQYLKDGENSRILVINSLHYNNSKYKYNHKKLILDPFKNGKQIN